jgi:hypothetical protein
VVEHILRGILTYLALKVRKVPKVRKALLERKVPKVHKELPDPAFLRVVQLGKR